MTRGTEVTNEVTDPDLGSSARRARGCLFELVETVVLTVLIFLGIQTFVAQPFQIQMQSMENTLLPEQYVLVDKLTPRWSPYARGDIVVFDPPEELGDANKVPFIKRVIGLPGDHVELRDGNVYVNDVGLDEPYVFGEDGVPQPTEPSDEGATDWIVPPGELFLLGDHRQQSEDSRVFGFVEISHIIGRAWLRYWPLDSFGILPRPPGS
jgi:signal peptidase I